MSIEHLKMLVGPRGWIEDPDALEPYLKETRGLYRGAAQLVVRPASTEEVAAVLRHCNEAGIAVVPQGGNTGLCGAAVAPAGSVILSLGRMNRVREVDPLTFSMTVEAGCILADLQRVAAEHDRLFPLSLGAEGSAQIGGNLSTNAGGTQVLRYGNARDLVLGLEVALPDGRIWDGLKRLRKDNTGYELRHLFVGAEGTLGVITAAALKLFPRPRAQATAFVALETPHQAIELLSRARADTGDQVSGFELLNRLSLAMVLKHGAGTADPFAEEHPNYVLVEVTSTQDDGKLDDTLADCLGRAAEDGLITDAVIAQNQAQAKAFWRLRELVSEVQAHEGGSIKHDVSVPVAAIADFIERAQGAVEADLPGIRVVSFGHVGDGNVHFNLSQPVAWDRQAFLDRWEHFNRIVHDIAVAMRGSFSAEHGIGQLKLHEMVHYKSVVELDLMRRIKQALDPRGIMNPGKVLPPEGGRS